MPWNNTFNTKVRQTFLLCPGTQNTSLKEAQHNFHLYPKGSPLLSFPRVFRDSPRPCGSSSLSIFSKGPQTLGSFRTHPMTKQTQNFPSNQDSGLTPEFWPLKGPKIHSLWQQGLGLFFSNQQIFSKSDLRSAMQLRFISWSSESGKSPEMECCPIFHVQKWAAEHTWKGDIARVYPSCWKTA